MTIDPGIDTLRFMTNLPICDFCSSPDVRWRYHCESFTLLIHMLHANGEDDISFPWESIGDWGACETCAAFIEADDWDKLAAHSMATSQAFQLLEKLTAKGEVLKATKTLHENFRIRKEDRVPA